MTFELVDEILTLIHRRLRWFCKGRARGTPSTAAMRVPWSRPGGWFRLALCALACVQLVHGTRRTCASRSERSERHVMRTQVAVEDTVNGIVHHANLLHLFERAAVEMLGRAQLGELFAEEGLILGAESIDVLEYGVSARIGDHLEARAQDEARAPARARVPGDPCPERRSLPARSRRSPAPSSASTPTDASG